MKKILAGFRSGLEELRRTPLLIALLVVGPAYVIYFFTLFAPDGLAIVHLGEETLRTTLPEAFPAFTTPMTAALLAGIAGLFLMETASSADSRLVVAGYRTHQVILARLGLVAGIALVASGVSIGVMLTAFQPELLIWFIAGTTLTALIYGMIGLIIGVLLNRLLGIYLILFGSMIDLFVFQNPLAQETPVLARILPGHYPLQLVMEAGFKGSISLANFGYTLGYLCVLALLGILGFYQATELS
jgi:ABC-2 type transport system permease protein